MPWFPKFLNWGPALAAAAIVVPALLALYFLKLRRRLMDVPTTLLWKKAIQDLQVNAPFQRLRRNLLLLLQLLLLLFLALALSRPVSNYRPGAGKTTVLLIDRSASMGANDVNGHTRLDEAKRRAKEIVDSMARNSTASVIAFDDTAQTLQTFTSDTAGLRRAIDSIEQTDRRSRLKLAFQLADATLAFDPANLRSSTAPPDVRLFSDGRVLDAAEVSLRGNLIFEKIGSDAAANVGIVALSAKRNYERPTEVQVFARLANFGAEPVEVPVQLSVDGDVVEVAHTRTRDTFLPPERWDKDRRELFEKQGGRAAVDSVDFQLDLSTAAVITLEQMHKEGDVLAADDVAQVVIPPPKTLSVLLVTEGNYFLEKAMDSLDLKKPEVMRPQVYEEKVPQNYDVIIFDRFSPKVLPSAGSFLYFLDGPRAELPPDLKVKVAKDPAGKPITVQDVGVLDWKRDHPILHQLGLNKLYVAEAVKLELPPEAQVLLDGLKCPLIVLHHQVQVTDQARTRRTFLICAFDLLQSNWPLKVTFPIFLHNAMQFLSVGDEMDIRQSYPPGATPVIPRQGLKQAGNDLTKIRLLGPEGARSIPIQTAGDFALPPLDRVGIYKTDPPIPGFEQMAVNLLDANESNIQPMDRAPGNIDAPVEEVKDHRARLELWWWIVTCVALPLLMIEWWVYTRRVHL